MESLPVDVLEDLLSYLDNDEIFVMLSDKNFRDSVELLLKRNSFWLKRLENQLSVSAPDGVVSFEHVNWRTVFNDIHRLFSKGGDIFTNACIEGNIPVVEIMLSNYKFDEIVEFANEPIRNAVAQSRVEIVRLLLKDGRFDPNAFDPNAGYHTPIVEACNVSCYEIVEMLLADKRVDMTRGDNSYALNYVGIRGDPRIVKLFLDDIRINPNLGNALIIGASVGGHYEIVKMLLDDGRIDPSVQDNQPIKLALENEHYEVAELLKTDNRVDPNATSEYTKGRFIRKTVKFLISLYPSK